MKIQGSLMALILAGTLTAANAENTVNLCLNDGGSSSWAVPKVKTFTFGSGQMSVNFADGTNSTVDIPAVRKLTFTKDSDGAVRAIVADRRLAAYPNPATDYVNVLNAQAGLPVTVVGLDGRLWLTGESSTQLYVGNLPSGFYLLKVGNETLKFRKQ